MRRISLLALFFLLLFTSTVYAKSVILVIGDSISAAYGIKMEDGWVALLAKRLQDDGRNYEVINASRSGATTAQGLAALPGLLAKYQPALTIIELAGNDALLGLQPAVIKKNLLAMIRLAQSHHSKVILLSVRTPPNYGKVYHDDIQAMFNSIHTEEKIIVIPLHSTDIQADLKLLQADKIHPTKEAQPLILDKVWPSIKSSIP